MRKKPLAGAVRVALAGKQAEDGVDRAPDRLQRSVPEERGEPGEDHEHERACPDVGGREQPARRLQAAEYRGQGEHREGEDGGRVRDRDGGQPGGHVVAPNARADEQPVGEGPGGGGPARDHVARGVAGELRRPHGEPARRAQRDPLHLPERRDARRLEDDCQKDPPRLEVGEGVPLREEIDEAREEEVERDGRREQEQHAKDHAPRFTARGDLRLGRRVHPRHRGVAQGGGASPPLRFIRGTLVRGECTCLPAACAPPGARPRLVLRSRQARGEDGV